MFSNPGVVLKPPGMKPPSHAARSNRFVAALALPLALAFTSRALAQIERTAEYVERVSKYPIVTGNIADARSNVTRNVRIRLSGTVTHNFGPGFFYLHDDAGDIRVRVPGTNSPARGERVEVTGVPRIIEGASWIELAAMRSLGPGELPAPRAVAARDAARELHDAQYIKLRGRVLGSSHYILRGTTNEALHFDSDGFQCKAMFAPGTDAAKRYPPDTIAEFTGICRVGGRIEEVGLRYVHVLVDSPADVRVIEWPPFWSRAASRRLLWGSYLLAALAIVWILWQWRKAHLLGRSEERFRALIENSFDGTMVLNADGSLKYLSPAAMRLLGGKPEGGAFMKNRLSDVIHPDDLPRIIKAHAEVLEEPGRARTVSGYRLLRTDGTIRYAEAIGTNCLHVPGVAGVVINLRDITDRMQADEIARRSESVTRTINYFATSLLERETEEDILWDLAQNCISQLGFHDCVVYLLDRARGVLVQKAALGPKSPTGRVIVNPIEIPLGQGIVGSVAVSGQAELIGDTSLDARYLVDDERRFSEITVPILAGAEVIGVIDSEHPDKNFFTADHLKMLTAIASLCANKLARAKAERELRESHQDLEERIATRTGELLAANQQLTREIAERTRAEKVQRALYAISEAIHGVDDLPSLYQRIHEIIGTLMPAKNFYISLFNAATDTVSFPYHRDEMDPPPAARKARRGMTEYVLRTGRSALADLDEIERLKAIGEYVQSGAPAKIWLGVPLSSGGRPFGVMAVQDHHNERVYGEEEKQILSFVAGQTALAIERKRAGSDLLDANRQLTREVADRTRAEKVQRALFAISEAIHNVQDLPSLYPRIHEIVGTLMPAGNFYIALHDAATDVVSFPYYRDELEPLTPPPRQHGRGLTEYVLRAGHAVLINATEAHRLFAGGAAEIRGATAQVWLGVPLSTGRGPFGVMVVQDHHNPTVYGEEEKNIISFVAGQIALAIERKRAESDLRAALAAEKELNQLKSSFVSMVSHEFRTPLEVILSSSNILDRYLDRLPPEKRAAQLRAIRKSVHRMNDLIDDVLLLGKFDAGALTCQPVPLDLAAFCRRAANEIESASSRTGVVQFNPMDINGDACADEGLLQHILTNILGNAVKYSPPGRAVEFTLSRRDMDAEFVIRDRGCGIPAADQARLFTAFYRGSNVGKTSGSGLGLVIAKRCVDLHGGTIRCESREGEGTTFTVTLPVFDGTRVFRRRPAEIPEPDSFKPNTNL